MTGVQTCALPILTKRAEALAASEFAVKKQGLDADGTNWLYQLLDKPNPIYTRSQVYKLVQNWLDVAGNAYIWTPTNGGSVPVQMWVLDASRTQVEIGETGVEVFKTFINGRGYIEIPGSDVIHLANLRALQTNVHNISSMPIFGHSLVAAALDYAGVDYQVSEYLQRYFYNDAMPPLIASSPEDIDPNDWANYKARWNQQLPNYKLRAALSGGMNLVLPPKSELGLTYSDISRDTRIQIAQVFGIPPGMLSGDFQNRATSEVQYAIFRQQTIYPIASYFAEELTRHFSKWDSGLAVEAKPFVFNDAEEMRKIEEHELRNGIKTINEARADRGLHPIPGGDVPLIASGFVALKTVAEPAPVVSLKKTRAVNFTEEEKRAFYRSMDNVNLGNEKLLAFELNGILEELEQEFVNQIENGGQLAFNLDRDKVADIVDEVIKSSVSAVAADLKIPGSQLEGDFGQGLKELAYTMESRIFESVGGITDDIRQVIAENANQSKATIMAALRKAFDGMTNSRIKAIAQTSSNYITTNVQTQVYSRYGFKYSWLTKRDGRVRDAHKELDGRYPDATGFFTMPSGHRTKHPCGAGLDAAEAVNCRCVLFPEKVESE